MTFKASVRVDDRAMRRDLKKVKRNVARRVTLQALNRAGARSRTASVRAVSKLTGIKQAALRGRVRLRKASRRRLVATLTALTLGIRAGDIGNPRQSATGARVGKKSFPGAFVATLQSGKTGVFRRKQSAASSTGRDRKGRLRKNRLPIEHERIEIRAEMEREVERAIRTVGAKVFKDELERLLARALRR